MRSLPELLASGEGRAFLQTRGVFTSETEFVDHLHPPPRGDLAETLGIGDDRLPVYTAHQVKADYAPSVVAKIRSAGDLQAEHPEVAAVLVWLDMDRVGSDKWTAAIGVHGRGGAFRARLASRRQDEKEARFVPVEHQELEEITRKLGNWARQEGAETAERSDRLIAALLAGNPGTLAAANLRLTTFLIRDHLGLDAPSALVSNLTDTLTPVVNDVVEHIDDVVTVFNAAVDTLLAADVDPKVRPLPSDYLPLHYSCDRDDRRCTLRREQRGADRFAETACACGAAYRFHLESIDELAATGRWSPDVTLPIYLNDLAGGVVAGQSSALYGLVLNEVVEKVLAGRPIPMFVPPDLGAILADESPDTSLLQDYLTGP